MKAVGFKFGADVKMGVFSVMSAREVEEWLVFGGVWVYGTLRKGMNLNSLRMV